MNESTGMNLGYESYQHRIDKKTASDGFNHWQFFNNEAD